MYNKIRRLQDINIKDKTVVVRVNYDVLLNEDEELIDNTYIAASVETIEYLLNNNCKVVLISHLGEPNGQPQDELSLMPARFELGKLLNKPIKFAHVASCENSIKFMEKGEVLLLENLKFDHRESSLHEDERKTLVEPLARLCDVYVNESFGVYEELASVIELPQMLKSVAGFYFQKEIDALSQYKDDSKRPAILVLGGGSSKVDHVDLVPMLPLIDTILVGGKVGLDFLHASGQKTGAHRSDPKTINTVKNLINEAQVNNVKIIMPVDYLTVKQLDETEKPQEIKAEDITDDSHVIDIGSQTIESYREHIENAQAILWNGPMGIFEWTHGSKGTEAIGELIGLSAQKNALKIAGGSHTLYAMKLLRIKNKRFTHTSIGGNMMLTYICQPQFSVINALSGKQTL